MKKFILFIFLLVTFITKVNAENKFYLGEKITDMYYIMDKNGTKVFANFKKIYKTDTGELVYCVEPGVKLSSDDYVPYESYNENFYIDQEKMDKVKLIAKYGYLYGNHTDIKWYAITQYMIWHTVMSRNWDLYFVDANKNRLYDAYKTEIDEINNLINNHHDSPNILQYYEFNYKDPIVINDNYNLLNNYRVSSGFINDNKFYVSGTLEPGNYKYTFNISSYQLPLFYNHPTGQDIYVKGEIYNRSFDALIHIKGGKLMVNECDEKTFRKDIIGGVYEVLNEDDEVEEEIDCSNNNEYCLSKTLPVGKYKIRVKSLPDDYEKNEYIYDVEVKDEETSSVDVCSLRIEKEPLRSPVIEEIPEVSDEMSDEELETIEVEELITDYFEVVPNYEDVVIDIPYTSKYKNEKLITLASIIIFNSSCVIHRKIKHENI